MDEDFTASSGTFRKIKRAKPPTSSMRASRKASSPPVEAEREDDVDKSGDSGMEELSTSTMRKRRQLRSRRKNQICTTSKKRRDEMKKEEAYSSSSADSEEGERSALSTSGTVEVRFASTGAERRDGPSDMGATARCEIDTEQAQDAQSQFERTQRIMKERAKTEVDDTSRAKEKIYQGMALYGAKEREDTAKGSASSGLNRRGPIRASQYMRANVRWDYAPDICKDYKETGFCTFGDSCKFLHDRSDYKHGWEIERDWEAGRLQEVKDNEYLISGDEDEDEDSQLPHHCHICREHFKSPVVTKCKHYFCEQCALSNSKKCAVCSTDTEGIFKTAKDLIAKLESARSKKTTKGDNELPSDDSAEGDQARMRAVDEGERILPPAED